MLFIYVPFLTLSQTDDLCQNSGSGLFHPDENRDPVGSIPSRYKLVPYLIRDRFYSIPMQACPVL